MKTTAKTNVKDHEQARAEITYKGKKAIMSLDWEKPSRFYIHVRGSGVNTVIAEAYDPREILKEWVKAMKQYQGELVARTPKQKELLQKQKELAAGFWKTASPYYAPGFLRAIRMAYLKDIREGAEAVVQADLKLSPADKKVLDAFTSQKPAEGKKFSSDGKRLDGLWMGGRGIAEWKSGKLHIRPPTSRSDQTVARMLKKMTPKNLLAGSVKTAADNGPALAAQKLAKAGKYAQAIKEIQKLKLAGLEGGSLKTAIINILDEASYEQASPKYVNAVMDKLVQYLANPASMRPQEVLRIKAGVVRQANLWLPREIPAKVRPMIGQVGKALDWDVTSAAGFAVAILEDVNAHDAAKKVNILLNKIVLQDVNGKVKGEDVEGAERTPYQLYFDKKLKEWGIKSPTELDDAKKKKFFEEVDKGWKSKDEKSGCPEGDCAKAAVRRGAKMSAEQIADDLEKKAQPGMQISVTEVAYAYLGASNTGTAPVAKKAMDILVKKGKAKATGKKNLGRAAIYEIQARVVQAATWNVKGKQPAKDLVKPLVDNALAVAAKRIPDLLKSVTKMELTYGPGRQMADVEGKIGTLAGRFEVSVIREYDDVGTWHIAVNAGNVHKEWSDKGAKGAQIGATIAKLLGQGLQRKGSVQAAGELSPKDLKRGLKIINKNNPEWGEFQVLGPAKGTQSMWEIRSRRGTRLLDEGELKFWKKA